MEYTVEQGFKTFKRVLVAEAWKIAPTLCEDIVSEYFLILLRKNMVFKNDKQFLAYSMVSVRNIARDAITTKYHSLVRNAEWFDPDWFPDPEESINPDKRIEMEKTLEMETVLMDGINKLSKKQKYIVTQRYTGVMPLKIAQELKMNVHTVRSTKTYAIDRLRNHFSSYEKQQQHLLLAKAKERFTKRMKKAMELRIEEDRRQDELRYKQKVLENLSKASASRETA